MRVFRRFQDEVLRTMLPRTTVNKGLYLGATCEGCALPPAALCYPLLGKEGRGLEASLECGHLLGRVEPVAQPATPKMGRWLRAWESIRGFR